jgi:hypothetical protein
MLRVFKWLFYEMVILGTLIDDFGDFDSGYILRQKYQKKQDELWQWN